MTEALEAPPFRVEENDFAVLEDGRFMWIASTPEWAGGAVGWWVFAREIRADETLGEAETVALHQMRSIDTADSSGKRRFKSTTIGKVN